MSFDAFFASNGMHTIGANSSLKERDRLVWCQTQADGRQGQFPLSSLTLYKDVRHTYRHAMDWEFNKE